MKGLHPVIVYVLLFAAGITIFFSIYAFTNNFINQKQMQLQKIQAEKICKFLKNLEGIKVETEIELGDYRIETNPLRIVVGAPYPCALNITTQGNCSGLCKIKSLGEKIIFS